MPAGAISLEEFKARLPLAEIVGRYMRLIRRGREHVGLCPFHKERSPSFNVVEDKGFYHCFGCGAHGTAIDFIMAVERCEFPEALERLSEITGIPAPSRREPAEPRVDRTLYDVTAAAAAWFRRQLAGGQGAAARSYLERRGIDRAVQDAFGIGFAPAERTALRRALTAEGLGEAQLIEAGLLVVPEDGGERYDRFRERVIFPIQDGRGRVVGFGGRAMGDAKPKYLNSPDGPLFHKGRLLYNLAGATAAARERGTVIVAEGYVDVIALTQADFPNAVAPLGTAVTEEQLELLWKLTPEPVVCLDGDAAGLRAAGRAAERALPLLKAGRSLRFALLPAGEDPDSLLRHQGAEALATCLKEPIPLLEFLWRQESAAQPLDTPERRAALQRRLRELTARIGDGEVRGHYRAMLFERVSALFPSPWQRQRERGRITAAPQPASPALKGGRLDAAFRSERRIVAAIVAQPALLHEVEEELAQLELEDPRSQSLRAAILDWYALVEVGEPAGLRERLEQEGLAQLLPAEEPGIDAEMTAETWRLMVHSWQGGRRAKGREVEETARRSAIEGESAWAAGLARIGALVAERASVEVEAGNVDFEAEVRSHGEFLQEVTARLAAARRHDPAEG